MLWNAIPGWNGTRKVTTAERRSGAESARALMARLPELTTIVMIGKKAQKADQHLNASGLTIYKTALPSLRVKNIYPEIYAKSP